MSFKLFTPEDALYIFKKSLKEFKENYENLVEHHRPWTLEDCNKQTILTLYLLQEFQKREDLDNIAWVVECMCESVLEADSDYGDNLLKRYHEDIHKWGIQVQEAMDELERDLD